MSDSFQPLVSIVIPVYNGSNFLAQAIDSALAQTYPNFEVLVINDGSNDQGKTRDIALSYGEKIRYFEKENGGVATALNLGIEKMRGEYFSWLSHDDKYLANKIKAQIDSLKSKTNKEVVLFGGWYVIDHMSNVVTINNLTDKHSLTDLNKPLYPLLKGIIHGCSLLVPRRCFEEVGLFDKSLRTTQDYDLWFRILKKYPICYIDEILIQSRDHEEQGSKKEGNHLIEANNLWIKFIEEISETDHKRYTHNTELYYYKMAEHLKQSSLKDAFHHSSKKYNTVKHNVVFSVIIPTHNRAYCIGDAIESVLSQTYTNYEIIIVDDGSTDNTEEVLSKYHDRVVFVKQSKQGVSVARNTGIGKSTGKYVAFLDSDDLWTEDHLEKHFQVLEANLDYAMSYNFANVIDYATGQKKDYQYSIESSGKLYPNILFISKTQITTPSVVIRKCILEEIGTFDDSLDMCEDLDLWHRISKKYQIWCIPEFLTTVRERENQFNPNTYYIKRKHFLQKAIHEDKAVSEEMIIDLLHELYKTFHIAGCRDQIIIEDLCESLVIYPTLLNRLLICVPAESLDNNSILASELERLKASVYYKIYDRLRRFQHLRLISNYAIKPAINLYWNVFKCARGVVGRFLF